MANLGRIAIVPKGEFNQSSTYKKLDLVQLDGSSYIALSVTLAGESPLTNPVKWMLTSIKGNDGADGTNGTDGLKGDKGDAFVYSDFTPEQLELLQGAKGDDGLSAYEIAVNGGFVGTETEWIASLKGEKGDDGGGGTVVESIFDLKSFYRTFSPKSISSLEHWYDITEFSGLTTVGSPGSVGNVSTIKDKIGGVDMVQVTDTKQPILKRFGGSNSMPFLEITASRNIKSAGFSTAKTQPYTVIMVIKPITTAEKKIIINFGSGTLGVATSSLSGVNFIGAVNSTAWTFNAKNRDEWMVLAITVNLSETKSSVNGAPYHSHTETSPGTGVPQLIGLGIDSAYGSSFHFSELMYFNGTLNENELSNVSNHLLTKYNIAPRDGFYLIGDSISNGTAATSRDLSFGYIAAENIGAEWLDYAMSGSTIYSIPTQYGSDPYFNTLLRSNDYYVIAMGTNEDSVGADWNGVWRSRLAYAHDVVGIPYNKIVFVTPPYHSSRASKLTSIQNIGIALRDEFGITYADCVSSTLSSGGDSLLPDGTHPNTAGHAIMAQTVTDAILANQ